MAVLVDTGGAGSTPRSAVSAAATLCQCRSPNGPFEVVRQGLFECVSRDDQGELFVGTFMDEAKLRQYLCPHGSATVVAGGTDAAMPPSDTSSVTEHDSFEARSRL
eukprot:COSAG01_NODE_38015_length_495_cov_2.934343_1_plen_105_part_01